MCRAGHAFWPARCSPRRAEDGSEEEKPTARQRRPREGGSSAELGVVQKRTANKRRIDNLSWNKPSVIVCLIVQTVGEVSHRVGILEIMFNGPSGEAALKEWGSR